MTSDGKLNTILGCTISKNQFVAKVMQGNNCIKTKTRGWGENRTCDEAYKDVINEAKKLSKEYRCEFFSQTKENLLKSSKGSRRKKDSTTINSEPPLENPLIAKFGNELAFKAMIKNAVKHHGLDKTIEVLDTALSMAKGMQAEIAKEKSIISSANIEIARVIVKTRNQGVHMASPSKEIDAAIQWVIENDNKPKLSRKAEPNARYKLLNQEWDGTGQAPTSIAQYLAANENRTLDDLRIN